MMNRCVSKLKSLDSGFQNTNRPSSLDNDPISKFQSSPESKHLQDQSLMQNVQISRCEQLEE